MKARALGIAALAALAVVAGLQPALAQYPDKGVTVIVPFPPGGASDTTARMVTPKLAERLGQSVTIDNKGGANGAIGAAP